MNQALHAICFSRGLARQRHWQRLLGVDELSRVSSLFRSPRGVRVEAPASAEGDINRLEDRPTNTVLVDWGNKRQSIAQQYQQQQECPLLRLEDGFIRSIAAGPAVSRWRQALVNPSLSLIVDDMGIYYDARQPSRLEHWLNKGVCDALVVAEPGLAGANNRLHKQPYDLDDPQLLLRARQCIDQIVAAKLSKYNDAPSIELPASSRSRVLLIDQVASDFSIVGAGANHATFERMLDRALQDHPDAEIIIKGHPVVNGANAASLRQKLLGVFRRKPSGHYHRAAVEQRARECPSFNGRLRFISDKCNVVSLLQQVDEVYVVSSQVGFEALMLAKPVRCFAQPFYAGWGLTQDESPSRRRTANRSIEQVFAAAYFAYSYYFDPLSGERCELEVLLNFFDRQREYFYKNQGLSIGLGFPPWKRAYLKRFLYSPWGQVMFCRSGTQVQKKISQYKASALDGSRADGPNSAVRVFVWGANHQYQGLDKVAAQGVQVICVEDGFIRSVGLGKYYVPPVSLVFDGAGIYYDPALADASQASDLERMLGTHDFADDELAAADQLVAQLIATQVTKYNVGSAALPKILLQPEQSRLVVLVVGQVEDDASIKMACADIRTDYELLKRVRERRPEALLVYKPHPDVVSGNSHSAEQARRYRESQAMADVVITEVSMADCLAVADELHTMTSLAGFEALLRGVAVFTYGLPFYAGWGLTEDALHAQRRRRRLTLRQLVVGVLLRYPRYIDYRRGYFLSAEQALARITSDMPQGAAVSEKIHSKMWIRSYRKTKNLLLSLIYGLIAARKD